MLAVHCVIDIELKAFLIHIDKAYANSVDPDQPVSYCEMWSGSALFAAESC